MGASLIGEEQGISTPPRLVASDQVAATIFAVEMAELVEQTTGHAVSVWGSVCSMPLGTISWTSRWPVSSTPLRKPEAGGRPSA